MTNDQRQGDAPDPFTILDVPDAGQYELHDGATTTTMLALTGRILQPSEPQATRRQMDFTHDENPARGRGSRGKSDQSFRCWIA